MFCLNVKEFAIKYLLYLVLSFVIYLTTSFTIAAWLLYIGVLAPFYLLCTVYVISLATTKRHAIVRFNRPNLLLLLGIQGLMVLASPASCYGWKQGQRCYSLLQTWFVHIFTDETLNSFTHTVPRWDLMEPAFLALMGGYIIAMIVFLAQLRFDP